MDKNITICCWFCGEHNRGSGPDQGSPCGSVIQFLQMLRGTMGRRQGCSEHLWCASHCAAMSCFVRWAAQNFMSWPLLSRRGNWDSCRQIRGMRLLLMAILLINWQNIDSDKSRFHTPTLPPLYGSSVRWSERGSAHRWPRCGWKCVRYI